MQSRNNGILNPKRMNRYTGRPFFLSRLIALLLLFCVIGTASVSLGQDTGSVSGVVTRASDGQAVNGASVRACPVSGDDCKSLTLQAEKSYTIPDLSPGSYRIYVFPPGSSGLALQYYPSANYYTAVPLTITAGQTISGIDFHLTPGGKISGTVKSAANNQGIPDLKIYAYDTSANGTTNWSISNTTSKTAGSEGKYTISGLPPGNYKVIVHPGTTDYAVQFYPNGNDPNAAEIIPVAANQTVSGKNISLPAGGKISGTVGNAAAGANIYPYDADSIQQLPFSVATEADGTYTTYGLPAGRYRILAASNDPGYINTWYGNALTSLASTPIVVTAGNTAAGKDMTLTAGAVIISGRVVREADDQPVVGIEVHAFLKGPIGERIKRAKTDYDGYYTLDRLPPADYRIYAGPTNKDYAGSYWNAAVTYNTATIVTAAAGQAVSGINFRLTAGGTVIGTVTRASDGARVSGVQIKAYEIPELGSAVGYRADTQADGSYALTGLPTGTYKIRAYASLIDVTNDYASEYYNGTSKNNDASPVAVTAGSTTGGIDFNMKASGSISGTVRNGANNQPVANLMVRAYDTVTGSLMASIATSTDDGSYVLTGLPAGSYIVQVLTTETDYLTSYFNNVTDIASATPASVTVGHKTSGIDFSLITGQYLEEAAIRTMITALLTAYNNKNIDTLMSYFAPTYLDNGNTCALQRAAFIRAFAGTITPVPTTANLVKIDGNLATVYVTGGAETLYLTKLNGVWLIYGNQKRYGVKAYSGHQAAPPKPNAYWVEFLVEDPSDQIQTITVSGNGLSSPVTLNHNTANHRWVSWSVSGTTSNVGPVFGNTLPAGLPYTYTFTITDASGITTSTSRVNAFVTAVATPIAPAANAVLTGTPSFSWTAVNGSYTYGIEIDDASYNRIWSRYDLAGTSFVYDGPALASGPYTWNMLLMDTEGNFSMVATPFTYSTISVSGLVRNWSGAVITDAQVMVSLVGDATKTAAVSPADGSFTLAGLPPNTVFSLKFSAPGYRDAYTQDFAFAADTNINVYATGQTPFLLPKDADLNAFGGLPASGKALIAGQMTEGTYRASNIVAGAVVKATGNGGRIYPVTYVSPMGVLGGSATSGNGLYYILNVDDGDTVVVTAAKSGWTFSSWTIPVHGNAVSLGRVFGTGPGRDLSFGGQVKDSGGVPVAGARIEFSGDPGKYTTSDEIGAFTLNGVPRDTNFYGRVTASGYAPTYIGPVNMTASFAGAQTVLCTAAQMAAYGVVAGYGMITGMVTDRAFNPMSGVTLSLTSRSGASYGVEYTGGGNSTSPAGTFLIANVQAGDVVKIQASKARYAFPPYYLDAFAGAATERFIDGVLMGDVNVDGAVNLADAILALQVFTRTASSLPGGYSPSGADIGVNRKIGLEEIIYILQTAGDLR